MHPTENIPVELLGCNGMKRNRSDRSPFTVGQETSDNVIGRLHQSVHHLMGQMLSNRLVLRYWSGSSKRMAKDGGFGGEREWIVTRSGLPFRPSGDYAGHIIDKTMDSTLLVMPVRSPLSNDEQVTLVRYSQCPF